MPILPLTACPDAWPAIVRILLAGAARPPGDSDAFVARWTGYYRATWPDHVLVHRTETGTVTAYLMGCPDSAGAADLFATFPFYGLFADRFAAFPAHFHINADPAWRGRGHGGALVAAYVARLHRAGCPGVHVVTAPEARNVGFYRRNGFTVRDPRRWRDRDLLLLGRPLDTAGP